MTDSELASVLRDARFRKSSYSGGGQGSCVVAADVPGGVLLQDSKEHPDKNQRRTLVVSAAARAEFVRAVRVGAFDQR